MRVVKVRILAQFKESSTIIIFLFCCLVFISLTKNVFAQTSDNYINSLNSLLPLSPSAQAIKKYEELPVSYATGIPSISIPIFNLEEKEINVPINLSYHAGGIRVDELASWVGAGWSLSAGGAITREVRGKPDEGSGDGIGLLYNQHTPYYYYNDAQPVERDIMYNNVLQGRADLEPDLFFFSMGNYSGKFAYNPETGKYVNISDQGLAIEKNSESSWTIYTPDGTTYIFATVEYTSTVAVCRTTSNNYNRTISAWNLTSIINPDKTDTIRFTYNPVSYYYYSAGSSTAYSPLNSSGSFRYRQDENCFSYNHIEGNSGIFTITSRKYKITFDTDTPERKDLPGGNALKKVSIQTSGGELINSYTFNYDYFDSGECGNIYLKDPATSRYRLRLLDLRVDGNGIADTAQRYRFEYNGTPLPCHLSYAQDFWGYANGAYQNGNSTDATTLAPEELVTFYEGLPAERVMLLPGSNRNPKFDYMKAGILTKITYPTGGFDAFEYEANTIGYNYTKYIRPSTIYKTISLSDIRENGLPLKTSLYDTVFVINEPPSELNNFKGGAFMTGISEPMCDEGFPYCGTYSISGPVSFNFNNTFPLTYFPNGTYHLYADVRNINNWEGVDGIRYFSVSLNYDGKDLSRKNYIVGGLRIKRITTTDNVRPDMARIREFVYHNEQNDSSYGFLGNMPVYSDKEEIKTYYLSRQNNFIEFEDKEFLVRHGNSVIPASFTEGALIFYPKVVEYITDGNIKQKKEHYFISSSPENNYVLPYVPAYDEDWVRGKPSREIIYQTNSTDNYSPLQINGTEYDFYPSNRSGQPFKQDITAVKVGCNDFRMEVSESGDPVGPMQANTPIPGIYMIATGRWYKTADTVIMYDNNAASLSNITTYQYGDSSLLPVMITTKNSKEESVVQEMVYAGDSTYSPGHLNAAEFSQLRQQHRYTTLLASRKSVNGENINQERYYYRLSGKQLLLDSINTAIGQYPFERAIAVPAYDNNVNPLTILKRNGLTRKYSWNKALNIPMAMIESSGDNNWFYTSFETMEMPSYVSIPSTGIVTATTLSGSKAYQLSAGNIIINGLNTRIPYDVLVWVADGGSCSVNGATMELIDNVQGQWKLYKKSNITANQITMSGIGLVDQLIVAPAQSILEGNTYNKVNQLINQVDQRGTNAFFEYDDYGRLKIVRDMYGNIIKQYEYKYQQGI
ncbi:hypothetical protein ACDQ55_08410 [Chitinophaga sp. 30R24]|uniref:hypothetical protein n=1 Tax=Chitinophaga sp. 30R24 TaxID=3248838 RepID=UPI003B904F40